MLPVKDTLEKGAEGLGAERCDLGVELDGFCERL